MLIKLKISSLALCQAQVLSSIRFSDRTKSTCTFACASTWIERVCNLLAVSVFQIDLCKEKDKFNTIVSKENRRHEWYQRPASGKRVPSLWLWFIFCNRWMACLITYFCANLRKLRQTRRWTMLDIVYTMFSLFLPRPSNCLSSIVVVALGCRLLR